MPSLPFGDGEPRLGRAARALRRRLRRRRRLAPLPPLEAFGPRPEAGVLVGGAVRDALLGREPKDLDWLVADPAGAAVRLARREDGHAFALDEARGHWRVRIGARTVDLVPLEGDLEADLARRDFTVNAIALTERGPVDPAGGRRDLAARRLRGVSPASLRDDPLRGLRGVRFAQVLGLTWDPATRAAAEDVARAIAAGEAAPPAAERVRDELVAIVSGPRPGDALLDAHRLGWLALALPELAAGDGVTQGAFHHLDVLRHGLEALQRLAAGFPDASLPLRLATLLHDVGKPTTKTHEPGDRPRFHGHAEVGADLARAALTRLRFDRATVRETSELVRLHMLPLPRGERAARRFVHRRRAVLPDLLKLMIADREAARGRLANEAQRRGYRLALARIVALLEEHPEPPPLLDGRETMALLGLDPGPRVGEALAFLRESQAVGDVSDREEARDALRRYARAQGWLAPAGNGGTGPTGEAGDGDDGAGAEEEGGGRGAEDPGDARTASRGGRAVGDRGTAARPPRRGARTGRALPWLAFGPSLAAGAIGALVLALRPWPFTPRLALLPALALGLAAGGLLLGAGWALERTLPSFRRAGRATDRALARLRLSRPAAAALALATALGEELLFRGVLLPLVGLVPQALVFGALHPAGRRAWSYPVYAAASALLLGGLVLLTGRLAPAFLAHLVVNATGLLGGARPRGGIRRRA